ncbi:ROK family protein [Butyrivibrio sp. YAB3001]|uniref:ROK family protein n=1 Tax=Butyrivibrio sp. YAB3001 TaxID=1520812 RepID=UPI0008F6426C|nr:ROK family protein [Butyrivibrio sp. YAB3001]SFC31594.1 glucokinase [Butyrivibrio sp. YAB3001]
MYRIGIDVGGTNIAIGLVDEDYKITEKIVIKTSEAKEPELMIKEIAGAVCEIIKKAGASEEDIEAIGVGVPGTAELDTGKIMYANNLGFEDVPFLPELKKALGTKLGEKTFFDNDANAAAIGEYITGGYDAPNFMMVTLGTGVGGGIIINGKLIRGCNFAAAEFGFMSINIEDKDSICGRKGGFEDYASASALIRQARQEMITEEGKKSALWDDIEDVEDLDGERFFAAVRKKDETAQKVLNRYSDYLAEGLTNLINILQPDVLVLSGGITRAADLFIDRVRKKVLSDVYSRTSRINTKITIARGIADAGDVGIIGAALIDKM